MDDELHISNKAFSFRHYNRSKDRFPLVKLSDVEDPLPLKSLGDGMTKIFHVILCLVCAKDGVLIVDEFENGLHWSTQSSFWKIVFKLSVDLNVQVFCSTHSRDCIKSFREAWGENESRGSFLRVDKENSIANVKTYDLELLSDSLEMDVEIR